MNKLIQLREQFNEMGIDGLLITSSTNRRYISGFTGTAGNVLISKTDAIFITDFRYIDQAKDQAKSFTIVDNNRDMAGTIATLAEKLNIKRLGFESKHVTHDMFLQYSNLENLNFIPTSGMIEKLRSIKTEDEIEILKHAAFIADATFEHILTYIHPGSTEIQVSNELERYMREQGAISAGFEIIVASGHRSALPHGVASSKVIEKGDLVTMDFGANYKGYRSDITRTIAVGELSDEWKEIYKIVLSANKQAIEGMKPGLSGKEVDALCRDYISDKGFGQYFGHGAGHGIGLDIHEEPFFATSSNAVLKPNMIVTMEPGIYLPNRGGIRIEDDVLITENGAEQLTNCNKELVIL